MTQVHYATYDVDHDRLPKRWKPAMPTFLRPHFIAAVDMQISQTAMTLAVVFRLFSTKQEKLLEIRFYCLHTSLVDSKAFKKPNLVFR